MNGPICCKKCEKILSEYPSRLTVCTDDKCSCHAIPIYE